MSVNYHITLAAGLLVDEPSDEEGRSIAQRSLEGVPEREWWNTLQERAGDDCVFATHGERPGAFLVGVQIAEIQPYGEPTLTAGPLAMKDVERAVARAGEILAKLGATRLPRVYLFAYVS